MLRQTPSPLKSKIEREKVDKKRAKNKQTNKQTTSNQFLPIQCHLLVYSAKTTTICEYFSTALEIVPDKVIFPVLLQEPSLVYFSTPLFLQRHPGRLVQS